VGGRACLRAAGHRVRGGRGSRRGGRDLRHYAWRGVAGQRVHQPGGGARAPGHAADEHHPDRTGSSTDDSGAKQEFKGKHADLDVTIQLERQDSATTKTEVYARKNLAEWDKDFARQVLEQIVKQR
jgi:hypothetical protein